MEAQLRASAERAQARICQSELSPAAFRAALSAVPAGERDAWLDVALGLGAIPDDGPALPRECVPYLPCPVDTLLWLVDAAGVTAADVFVDLGAGVGRAAALVHLATGASAIGLEIQPELVEASRALSRRLGVPRLTQVQGDAAQLAGRIAIGTVFFLYCPFGGERLERALDGLESVARTRQIRVCCLDLPLPARPWLALCAGEAGGAAVYRSTFTTGLEKS